MKPMDILIIAAVVLVVMKAVRNNQDAYNFVNSPWQEPAAGM